MRRLSIYSVPRAALSNHAARWHGHGDGRRAVDQTPSHDQSAAVIECGAGRHGAGRSKAGACGIRQLPDQGDAVLCASLFREARHLRLGADARTEGGDAGGRVPPDRVRSLLHQSGVFVAGCGDHAGKRGTVRRQGAGRRFVMPLVYAALILTALLLFHTVAGYPMLLAWRRRGGRKAVAKDPTFETTVTVVMAVHNGESMVRRKLEVLLGLDYPRELVNVIVVSDGSTDGTEAIVREFADKGVTLLAVPRGGKAAALNAGMAAAAGEIVFFTDVRQPLEPRFLRHLVANFADATVGAATGELRLLRGDTGEQADMDLYWRYEIWARQIHSRIDSLFTTTGCIYAMRRALAEPLPADTLSDDAVLPLRAFFRGY